MPNSTPPQPAFNPPIRRQMPTSHPLKVLVVHCAYQYRGGEDMVVEAETDMLREFGHDVRLYERHNDDASGMSTLPLALETIWSSRTTRELKALCEGWRPDVIHVHNTLLLVSPSVFWVASSMGIPVVQTLHNFRLACLNATLLREGKVCEDCLGKAPVMGVLRGCYRESKAQSAVLASSIMVHRAIGTFQHKVSRFIALTEFSRKKLIEAGLPAAKVCVKPNFAPDPPLSNHAGQRKGGLFVGRLSVEKGITQLLEADAALDPARYPIQVVGTGPLEAQVRTQFGSRYLGFADLDTVMGLMQGAQFLVLPSVCYEGALPRTALEAFCCAMPVIASRMGSMADSIIDGETGLLFEPGNSRELADKIRWAVDHPEQMAAMGRKARQTFETLYNKPSNHDMLTAIYREVIADQNLRATGGRGLK
jgi:glycosyltransferase involved in cell wall biosynthesis